MLEYNIDDLGLNKDSYKSEPTPSNQHGFTDAITAEVIEFGAGKIQTEYENSDKALVISTDTPTGNNPGADFGITAGAGSMDASDGFGGGGNVAIIAGNAQANNNNGGLVYVFAGSSTGTGTPGEFVIGSEGGGVVLSNAGLAASSSPEVGKMYLISIDGKYSLYGGSTFEHFGLLDFTNITSTDKTFAFPNQTGMLMVQVAAPASASATGVAGTYAYDASFLYVCVATDTWKRVAIGSW